MKPFNFKSFLNEKKIFLKNAIIYQKEKVNTIVNPTSTRGNDATENNSHEKLKERPYYESFISMRHSDHNDFLDYSGGMMGI